MEKGQSEVYRRQASHAVAIYYQIIADQPSASIDQNHPNKRKRSPSFLNGEPKYDESEPSRITPSKTKEVNHSTKTKGNPPTPSTPVRLSETRRHDKKPRGSIVAESEGSENGLSWNIAKTNLANEIKVRHYAKSTLQTYCGWLNKFQAHAKNKNPDELTDNDFKSFLTFLAVNQKVAASTQNQAFNAILFFFRHVLKREPGEIKSVRAKQKPYLPVVLTRKEINRILGNLSDPHHLIVGLLYGCGLRLFESLQLRVQDFNFDDGMLTVHDGKGKKDRAVPIPETIRKNLLEHRERVADLHEKDLAEGFHGTFLPAPAMQVRSGADPAIIRTDTKTKRAPRPITAKTPV